MKAEKETIQKIIRDGLISLFLYALPVLLMLLTFKMTGQQPWKDKAPVSKSQSK
jgi:hypothetical protein